MTPERAKYLLPVIQAFAEGKAIQCKCPQSSLKPEPVWVDALPNLEWRDNWEYRIKPETIEYRVALYCDGNGPPWARVTNQRNLDKVIERQSEFVRWLTDWIEVEV